MALNKSASVDGLNPITYTVRRPTGNNVALAGDKDKVITLKMNTAVFYSYLSTYDFEFVIVHGHTQFRNITLKATYNSDTNTNSNTAILRSLAYPLPLLNVSQTFRRLEYILEPPKGIGVQTLITSTTYKGKAPLPGGCCLTCTMEIDPNLLITSRQYYKSVLTFSLANVYDYKTSDCSGTRISEPRHYRLQYSIFQYFVEEGNLDESELFDGIRRMSSPSAVKENGKKVRDYNPKLEKPMITFDTERGQGIVFNILVYDPVTNMESVYSPAATYGCSFTAKVDGCDSLGSIASIVVAMIGSVLGLLACFFTHRFYQVYIVGSSMMLFSFLGFIALTCETQWTHPVRIVASVCMGILGGLLVYMLWWLTGYRHLVLYICGLPFGFLLTAVVFFTPFGKLHYWKNDINYWTVVLCMSLTTPCFLLLCSKTFVILNSTFVGAYSFVVGLDTFIPSSMTYIVLNLVMKATVDDFVKYDVPFQTKDYILTGVWITLTLLGMTIQFVLSRGRPIVPYLSPRKKRKQKLNISTGRTCETVNRSPDTNNGRWPVLVSRRRVDPPVLNYDCEEEEIPILVESQPFQFRATDGKQLSTRYGTNVVC